MKWHEYGKADTLYESVANLLYMDLSAALVAHEHALFVVPGGTTPGPIFDLLAQMDLPWSHISIMLSDERWVPTTSDRSNSALLRERLHKHRAAAAHIVPMHYPSADPEEGIAHLSGEIVQNLPISVLLLGMGADMHTASLFPGADNLQLALAANAPPLVTMRPDDAPEARITLTAPVLQKARKTHVIILGDEKRTALEKAQTLDPAQAPIKLVLDKAHVHWAP